MWIFDLPRILDNWRWLRCKCMRIIAISQKNDKISHPSLDMLLSIGFYDQPLLDPLMNRLDCLHTNKASHSYFH